MHKGSLSGLRMGEEALDRGIWAMGLVGSGRGIWQLTSLVVIETTIPAFPQKAEI